MRREGAGGTRELAARRFSIALMMVGCAGCSGSRSDQAADSGACDSDSDSDTDTDTDTDMDNDTDSDADTDTDTDTDSDTDSDTDTDTGSDTGTGSGSDPCLEPDSDSQCQGQEDFTFCSIDTGPLYGVDLGYDICVDGSCLSPGSCGYSCCNAPGPHFPPPPAQPEPAGYTRSEPLAGQPVVEDGLTGLVWQGCPGGMEGDLESCFGAAQGKSWSSALAYCDELSWGGWDDWYLPDPWELQSIADYGAWSSAVNAEAFPNTPWELFWTSSSRGSDPDEAWFVSAINGTVSCDQKNASLLVRCVRCEASPVTASRYVRTEPTGGQPVVEDSITGLIWQGCASGLNGDETSCSGGTIEGNRDAAQLYCDELGWGGYQDWRLPGIRELSTILDLRRVEPPLVDAEAFPDFPVWSCFFWSSTPFAASPESWQWRIDYTLGRVDLEGDYQGCALCVRAGR